MKEVRNRYIVLVCTFLLMMSASPLLMSCSMLPGGGAKPPQGENFLAEHETVLKLGTEAAVVVAIRANPTYEATVVKVAAMLDKIAFPADGIESMKDFVMKSVDLSKFSSIERIFVGLLVDEFVSQVEVRRNNYCLSHSTSVVCIDKGTWLKTVQIYLNKFAGWLRTGVALSHLTTTETPRSVFPVLEPLR